jgi:hypothetical protein
MRKTELILGVFVGLALAFLYARYVAPWWQRRLPIEPTVVYLRELAPSGKVVSDIKRLDTDGDGWKEWVVFYSFDRVGMNSPSSGAIFDREGKELPIIYPYKLRTPDSDSLGVGKLAIGIGDILGNLEGEARPHAELIITDALASTLTIFRVREVAPTITANCENYPNPYQVEGLFKGNLKITRAANAVSVWDRAGSERSQFALRRTYRPSQGSYFQLGTTTLLPPAEASIEFAFGMPADILDTPYPEKLVLAFYNRLVGGDPKSYLSEQAKRRFGAGQLDYGTPWPLGQVQKALVQEISYVPGNEDVASAASAGTQPQTAEVQVKVLFIGPGNDARLLSTRWFLIRQENRWQMHDAASS